MSDSNIEWTDATWNPVVGCSRVSPGCEGCYAEVMAARIEAMGQAPRYRGLTVVGKHGPRWSGVVRTAPEVLAAPLHWRTPKRVFVKSMSDLFHEDLPFSYIAAVFGVMAEAPCHTFQVLTKRPERAVEFFRWVHDQCNAEDGTDPRWVIEWYAAKALGRDQQARPSVWPLLNVHLGVSVESPAYLSRIDHLFKCPAAVRWVSLEPLIADLGDIGEYLDGSYLAPECGSDVETGTHLDWVVVGGESGRDPRPFDLAWARSIVAQCEAAGVPVFVKQLGAVAVVEERSWRAEGVGRLLSASASKRAPEGFVALHLGDKKGGDPAWWPEDLRVRQWPEVTP